MSRGSSRSRDNIGMDCMIPTGIRLSLADETILSAK